MITGKDIIELLALQNPEAVIWDGFDDAVIGYTLNHGDGVLIYSYRRMVEVCLTWDDMTEEDAHDYLSYNMFAYINDHMPIIIEEFTEQA